MIPRYKLLLSILIILLGVSSCVSRESHKGENESRPMEAEGFTIQLIDSGLYRIDIRKSSATDEKAFDRYYLVNRQKYSSSIEYDDGKVIDIPIRKVVLGSTTQLAFLKVLNEQQSIVAIANAERVYDKELQQRISSKEVINVGEGFDMSQEALMMIGNDCLILSSGYNEQRSFTNKNVITINEWLEKTALTRADWIRVFGCLYDKYDIAQHYIAEQKRDYIQLLDSVNAWKHTDTLGTKKVITGEDFRGVWYMPYSDNWLAHLINDAGGTYSLKNKQGKGSISRTLEDVYTQDGDADIWLGLDTHSRSALLNKERRYGKFKAFRNGQMYHFRKRYTSSGGNDFWESAVVEPVVLLSDFVKVMFPEKMKNSSFVYIDQLTE